VAVSTFIHALGQAQFRAHFFSNENLPYAAPKPGRAFQYLLCTELTASWLRPLGWGKTNSKGNNYNKKK